MNRSQWFERLKNWPEPIRAEFLAEHHSRFFKIASSKPFGFNDFDAGHVAGKAADKIAEIADEFDQTKRLWPWADQICRNQCRDHRRTRKSKKNSALSIAGYECTYISHESHRTILEKLAAQESAAMALAKTEELLFQGCKMTPVRICARLVIFGGGTVNEVVVEGCGTTIAAVNTELWRLRKKLANIAKEIAVEFLS